MITAAVSIVNLQDVFIENEVAYYNYRALEIVSLTAFQPETNVGVSKTA